MSNVQMTRGRRAIQLGVKVGAALCVIGLAGCGSSHESQPAGAESTAAVSSKPDITHMSETLVVGRDSFPDVPGGDWRAPYMYEHPESDESADCGPMLNQYVRGEDSMALASLKKDGNKPSFRIDLTLPSEPLPNWHALSEKCRSIGQFELTPRSLDGLPAWAVASDINLDDGQGDKPGLSIAGDYRGLVIYLQAQRQPTGLTDADLAACVKLFNDQVAKLEAAPA